jgi:hypothetical protein
LFDVESGCADLCQWPAQEVFSTHRNGKGLQHTLQPTGFGRTINLHVTDDCDTAAVLAAGGFTAFGARPWGLFADTESPAAFGSNRRIRAPVSPRRRLPRTRPPPRSSASRQVGISTRITGMSHPAI